MMAMLDITPIFVLVSMVFALVLIMFREWYFEDLGLAVLGFSFMIAATLNKDLVALLWLGITFLLIGVSLGIINVITVLLRAVGIKVHIDLFHRGD